MSRNGGRSCLLSEAFPDVEQASICSAYFTTADLTEKTWYDFEVLAKADDVTFWTVIAHHKKLSQVIRKGLAKIDHAQHATSPAVRRSVKKSEVKAITSVLLRIACDTAECVKRGVDATDLAKTIDTLLPLRQFLVFNASLMQLRHGILACVAGCSFHLLNPMYLCAYSSLMLEWRETVDQIVKRCVKELGRGRYQRLSGDILVLFEQTYRVVKSLWALLSTCPFIADYLALESVLRGLRIVVDVVSPLLQHFLLHCDDLNTRRELLSKANAGVVNASLSAAIILLLFRSFFTSTPMATTSDDNATPSSRNTEQKICSEDRVRERMGYLFPEIVETVEERMRESAEVYLRGYSRILLHIPTTSIEKGDHRRDGPPASGRHGRRGEEEPFRCEDALPVVPLHSLLTALWLPPSLSTVHPSSSAVPLTGVGKHSGGGGMQDRRIGEVLLVLKNPTIADSGDFVHASPKRQRFFQLVLAELANQQVSLDASLVQRGFLTDKEADTLGSGQQAVLCALAGIPFEEPTLPSGTVTGPSSSTPGAGTRNGGVAIEGETSLATGRGAVPDSSSPVDSFPFPPDSLEASVHEVLPHFSISMIQTALAHYNNDIEHLITDALVENLPPHLSSALQHPSAGEAHEGRPETFGEANLELEVPHEGEVDSGLRPPHSTSSGKLKGEMQDDTGVPLLFNPDALLTTSDGVHSHLSKEDFDDALQLKDLSLFFWDSTDFHPGKKGQPHGEGRHERNPIREDDEDGEEESEDNEEEEMEKEENSNEPDTDYMAYHPEGEETWGWSPNPGNAFQADQEMKDKIRMLCDMMMYEDELDDEGLQTMEVKNPNRPVGAAARKNWDLANEMDEFDGDEMDEEEEEGSTDDNMVDILPAAGPSTRGMTNERGKDTGSGWKVQGDYGESKPTVPFYRPLPRSDYDKKQFYANREKERMGRHNADPAEESTEKKEFRAADGKSSNRMESDKRPAYAKKNKTMKFVQRGRGRGKGMFPQDY